MKRRVIALLTALLVLWASARVPAVFAADLPPGDALGAPEGSLASDFVPVEGDPEATPPLPDPTDPEGSPEDPAGSPTDPTLSPDDEPPPDQSDAVPSGFQPSVGPSGMFGGTVDDFGALVNALMGGETAITLGGEIVIPSGEFLDLVDGTGLVINTGAFGIVVEGLLLLGENAVVTGDGLGTPVIDVRPGGTLCIGTAEYASAPAIVATAGGGTALSLREGASFFQNLPAFLNIRSNDGIGIRSEISLDLTYVFIDAGDGRGIVSDGGVSLFLCRVEGGGGAVSAFTAEIDTSILIPSDGYEEYAVWRMITGLEDNRTVLGIGEAVPQALYERIDTFVMFGSEWLVDRELLSFISLEMPAVDTSHPGTYTPTIRPEPWMALCGLEIGDAPMYTIAVCDLSIPALVGLDEPLGLAFYRYIGAQSDLTLWRSDDEGGTWADITDSAEFGCYDGRLTLQVAWEEHPVWLKWVVANGGESEILCLEPIYIVEDEEDPGGDRGGGDRGESEYPRLEAFRSSGGSPDVWPALPNSGQTAPGVSGAERPTNTAQTTAPRPAPPPNTLAQNDDGSLTVTGAAMRVMMEANPEYVTLLNGGMWMSIPAAYLTELSFSDEDVFTLLLTRLEDAFFVTLLFNGRALDDTFAEPFLLSLSWDGGEVSCLSEHGEETPAVLSEGLAVFSLVHTGRYRLITAALEPREEDVPGGDRGGGDRGEAELPYEEEISRAGGGLAFAVGGVGLSGTAGAIAFWRKRKPALFRRVKRMGPLG